MRHLPVVSFSYAMLQVFASRSNMHLKHSLCESSQGVPSPAPTLDFEKHVGYISRMGDILTATMTVEEAMVTALEMKDCKGFSFNAQDTGGPQQIYFKSKFDITHSPDWRSYKVLSRNHLQAPSSVSSSHRPQQIAAEKNAEVEKQLSRTQALTSFWESRSNNGKVVAAKKAVEEKEGESSGPRALFKDMFAQQDAEDLSPKRRGQKRASSETIAMDSKEPSPKFSRPRGDQVQPTYDSDDGLNGPPQDLPNSAAFTQMIHPQTKLLEARPTIAEYQDFLNVTNFDAELSDIVRIGYKVAAHIKDEEWKSEVLSDGRTRDSGFLHTPNWKKKSELARLPSKMNQPYYWLGDPGKSNKPLGGVLVGIVGGGPGGLRLAVEAALLGAVVHVVESFRKFNRFNILKLWEYSKQDLESIGAKELYPHIVTGQVKRVPIAVLQHILLRIALAVGVIIHQECVVEGLVCNGKGHPKLKFSSSCPSAQQLNALEFHALFDGSGSRALLRNSICHDGKQLIEAKIKVGPLESIGVTINFKRWVGDMQFYRKKEEEIKKVWVEGAKFLDKYNPATRDESNLGFQFEQAMFKAKDVGLKNWVYWRGTNSHYIVLTVPREELIEYGIVSKSSSELGVGHLLDRGWDRSRATKLGLLVANDWNFPHKSEDESAYVENFAGEPDISIFDYSNETTAQAAARFVPGHFAGENMFFGLLGDTMQTPFWPLGTGANHAIYSAQMQALALVAWKNYQVDEEETIELANNLMSSMRTVKDDKIKDIEEGGTKGNDRAARDYEFQIYRNYVRLGCHYRGKGCPTAETYKFNQIPRFDQ